MGRATKNKRPSGQQSLSQPTGRATRSRSQTPPTELEKTVDHRGPEGDRSDEFLSPIDEGDDANSVADLSAQEEVVDSIHSLATAVTSFSQEEISELDGRVIVRFLGSLYSTAKQITAILLPNEYSDHLAAVRKDLQSVDSLNNQLVSSHAQALGVYRRHFGHTHFIQPPYVLCALRGARTLDEVPSGAWRPDSLLYSVNLADMARTIITISDDSIDAEGDAYDTLQRLETDFAAAIAGQQFDSSAFRLYLQILAQVCLFRIAVNNPDESGHDAHAIINYCFFADEIYENGTFQHAEALHLEDVSLEEQQIFHGLVTWTVDQLHESVDKHPENIGALLETARETFDWTSFVDSVSQYCIERQAKLDADIAAAGGVDGILQNLRREVNRTSSRQEAEIKRRQLGSAPSKPTNALKGLQVLRMREKQLAESAAKAAPSTAPALLNNGNRVAETTNGTRNSFTPPLAPRSGQSATTGEDDAEEGFIMHNDEYDGPEAHDRSASSPHPTMRGGERDLAGRSTLSSPSKPMKSQHREREVPYIPQKSFIDRQPNARKVSFDASQPGSMPRVPELEGLDGHQQAHGRRVFKLPNSSGNSHKHEISESDEPQDFEPTPDDGFQTDTRGPSSPNKRRRLAAEIAPPAHDYTRHSGSGSTQSRRLQVQERSYFAHLSQQPLPSRQSMPESSAIPTSSALLPNDSATERDPAQQLELARKLAHQTAVSSSTARTRLRKEWTADEVNALVELIGKIGAKYAEIKKADEQSENPRLGHRTSEDIRFKARNMKVVYLQSYTVALPAGFEGVQLDAKARQILARHNVTYKHTSMRE